MFLGAEGVFDDDWPCNCALSEDAPAFRNRGISPSEGKPGVGFAGGRRLLTRGMSASAKSKNARDKASQFDMISAAQDLPGPTFLILRCHEAAEQVPPRRQTPLSYLSFIGTKLYYRTGIRAIRLAGHDLDALAVDGHGQDLCTRTGDGFLYALAGLRLD